MSDSADQRLELEYQIIGAMVYSRETTAQVLQILQPADFDALGTVYGAIRELFNAGAPIDRLTVSQQLGGSADHIRLIDAALKMRVMPSNAEYYAGMLREKARLTRLRTTALQITTANTLEDARQGVDALNSELVTRRQWSAVSMADAFNAFCDRHQETRTPEFLDFGFPKLRDRLYLEPGDFAVIAGEPSSGKTALAAQMAVTLAKKYRVGFFTLETSSEKLTDRIMAQLTQIPLQQIKKNLLKDAEWKKIRQASQDMYNLPLDQIPAAGMTVNDIQSYAIAHRYRVVIVDYLQIIAPANRTAPRYEQVTQISMGLHTMAQLTGIAVIALAQLSRPDKTKKKQTPPSMHDLRESGQIEQDADAVLLLYLQDPNNNAGGRVLKIGKNKEGERADFRLDFNGNTQTFSEAKTTWADIKSTARKAAKEAQLNQVKMEELTEEESGELPF